MEQKDVNNTTILFSNVEDCKEKTHNRVVHINKNWVICILGVLVLVLSAVILTCDIFNKDNVSLIISFTATILSIVLSLLAIVYSTLYNIESSGNLSEIRSAVSEIRVTEEALKREMQKLNIGVDKVKDNVSNMNNQLASGISSVAANVSNFNSRIVTNFQERTELAADPLSELKPTLKDNNV